MHKEHLHFLICPNCKNKLTIKVVKEEVIGKIKDGTLECLYCSQEYPVIDFVPRFVPSENYASGFGLQWNIHCNTQYDSYTSLPLSETRFFESSGWSRKMPGELILEAGSGSGRFTEHAINTGAFVISFDFSNAVDANYKHNGHNKNVLIVQADILNPPVKPKSFDKVFCFGVLQHTPNPQASFKSLVRFVKPGGSLAIDIYKKNRLGKLVSFTPAPPTKYYIRPVTKRMNPMTLYRYIKIYIDFMWPLCMLIRKIPKIGRNINWMLLVADHTNLSIDATVAKQWAYLNTFDMLAPHYDHPQTLNTIRKWFKDAELIECDINYGYNGIVGRGLTRSDDFFVSRLQRPSE